MNILVTGSTGFVGKNLCRALENIRDGKDRRRANLKIDEIFEYTRACSDAQLEDFCRRADFVFNLAGVNRPTDPADFMAGNRDFGEKLLGILEHCGNVCPVMLSSSTQASLDGRFAGSEYGQSKLAGEKLFFDYGGRTGAKVLVYRFPNLFGKWCRPNYNSAVATFCYNFAHDLPITVNDPTVELELLYIDDLVEEMFFALEGREHRCRVDGLEAIADDNGAYCFVPQTYRVLLGDIVKLLEGFKAQRETLLMPAIPEGSFEKKLYSTYLSYLPKEKAAFPLKMNADARGSFTELLKTDSHGQFSVNISHPGVTKGEHWHNTKWEFFIVVSGSGLIRQRRIGSDEILDFYVSGEKIEAVHMLPGYTHNIINLSDSENLVTLMWANECFDPSKPDTFYEEVEK